MISPIEISRPKFYCISFVFIRATNTAFTMCLALIVLNLLSGKSNSESEIFAIFRFGFSYEYMTHCSVSNMNCVGLEVIAAVTKS